MSRSEMKHVHLKYPRRRVSWVFSKRSINRYNRHNAKAAIRAGEEIAFPDIKLPFWDYDFFKFFYSEEEVREKPELKRK